MHLSLRHQVTPVTTRAGNTTRSIRDRSDNDSAHLVKITTDSTLSQLRWLDLYTKAFPTDIAHQARETESTLKYACATTNVQTYLAGGKTEVIPNTFEEAVTLPGKAHRKLASDKEVTKLKKVSTPSCRQPPFQSATRSLALVGCTRLRPTNPTRDESLCSGGDKYQASTAEARSFRSAGFRASRNSTLRTSSSSIAPLF